MAAILVLSRALSQSGATDLAARLINPATGKAQLHIAALSGLGAAMSSMMNNVGTLGLLMPVAVQSAMALICLAVLAPTLVQWFRSRSKR